MEQRAAKHTSWLVLIFRSQKTHIFSKKPQKKSNIFFSHKGKQQAMFECNGCQHYTHQETSVYVRGLYVFEWLSVQVAASREWRSPELSAARLQRVRQLVQSASESHHTRQSRTSSNSSVQVYRVSQGVRSSRRFAQASRIGARRRSLSVPSLRQALPFDRHAQSARQTVSRIARTAHTTAEHQEGARQHVASETQDFHSIASRGAARRCRASPTQT